ncbi:MAG: precorrin-6A/cobalt-precorrin-6A reductase, partial [Alphaproteobacteria bacterium]|nr:precorrin-6A/cobalt-precorrin-6A reductase [Alphaproteobacteria bacterium]
VRGLGEFLRDRGITDLVDATHPFAATMAQTVAASVAATPPIRMVKLLRLPSEYPPGLVVMSVSSLDAAAELVGQMQKNCLVLLGSRGGQQFQSLGKIPREKLWLHSSLTDSRPPDEVLRQSRAELLLLRDSGGALNQKWLSSAREAGVTVVLLTRPVPPNVPTVHSVAAVLHWLGSAAAAFRR